MLRVEFPRQPPPQLSDGHSLCAAQDVRAKRLAGGKAAAEEDASVRARDTRMSWKSH